MTHSFRFTDNMENNFYRCKKILSNISGVPIDDLNDTMVLNFVLNCISRDYGYAISDNHDDEFFHVASDCE